MVITAAALRAHADWVARGASGDGRLMLRGEDARGQDLRSSQLSGAILEDCKLEGALLDGTTWASASVTRTAFRDAVFGDARLDDARFVECDLRDADFSDLDARAGGTTARCRFERCDLRGSIWLERNVAGACFVECQFDLVAGAPRDLANVEIDRPRLSTPDGKLRDATAAEVLASWQSGRLLPHLSDDDRAYVRRGLQGRWRKREAYLTRGHRRPPATGVGSIADKWSSEPFLPDVAPAPAPLPPPRREPITLPAGSSPEASAWRAANGVTVYRDARSGFGMLLLPPVFLPPDDHSDLVVGVANTMIVRVVHLPRAAGPVAADDEASALVRRLLAVEPQLAGPGWPGVESTATGSSQRDEYVRNVAAIVGSDGAKRATVVVTLDYNSNEVDVATALAVWSALVSAVWFSGEPDEIPDLIPASVWWDAGFPLRLAASRPAVPAIEGIEQYAAGLIAATDVLPPSLTISDAQRAGVAGELARLDVAGAPQIAASLATVHDYRGLAFALLEADLQRPVAPPAASPPATTTAASPSEPDASGSAAREAAIKARVMAGAASAAAALAAISPPSARAPAPPAPTVSTPPAIPPPLPLPPPPTMPAPAGPSHPSPPILAAHRVVTITAAEASRTGLPAVGMTVDLGGTLLMERVRPEGRRYLMAGGPPGGALGFEVWASDETATDHAAVQRAVAAHYGKLDLMWGQAGTLAIAGAARPALTFLSGPGTYDPTHGCAVLVPHARGAVLVVVSLSHLGSTPVACDRVMSPDLAQAVKTFNLVER